MRKVIVTGAGGLLGNSLTKTLLENNILVYGITSDEKRVQNLKKYNNFISVVSSFSQYDDLEKKFTDINIDVFFHCAWQGITAKSENNIDFQLQNDNILIIPLITNILTKTNCDKFIFISSIYKLKLNSKETNSYIDNYYGILKETFSSIIKINCVKNEVTFNEVFFTTLYGENDNTNRLVNNLIRKAQNYEIPTLIKGDDLYDFLYIDDAVNGIINICEKGINLKSYYIGHRNLKTFKDIF